MQHNSDRLKIHTSMRPVQEETSAPEERQEEKIKKSSEEAQAVPQAACAAPLDRTGRRRRRGRERRSEERMTLGEKLVRNTAVACALLLTVMAMKNVDHPWTQKATEGIRQAMTMRIDWDDTLGRLSFVRALVPDAALVFLNMDGASAMAAPVDGELIHEYSEQQPWIEYRCSEGEGVYAALAGTVTATGQSMSGDWTVLIETDRDEETVYGYLDGIYVQVGQQIDRGQQIGVTAAGGESRVYFELREAGEAVDPLERMR